MNTPELPPHTPLHCKSTGQMKTVQSAPIGCHEETLQRPVTIFIISFVVAYKMNKYYWNLVSNNQLLTGIKKTETTKLEHKINVKEFPCSGFCTYYSINTRRQLCVSSRNSSELSLRAEILFQPHDSQLLCSVWAISRIWEGFLKIPAVMVNIMMTTVL